MTVDNMLGKNATLEYYHSNETPRASACMRTQRGSFFASTFASWFHHLHVVWNICAHCGRLLTGIVKVTSLSPANPSGSWVRNWPASNRVHASSYNLIRLLGYYSPKYGLVPRLRPLLAWLRPARLPSLGFALDRESQPLFIKGSNP